MKQIQTFRVSHDLRMKNRELFYIKKLKASLDRFNEKNMAFAMNAELRLATRDSLRPDQLPNNVSPVKKKSEIQEKSNIFDRRSKSLGKSLKKCLLVN